MYTTFLLVFISLYLLLHLWKSKSSKGEEGYFLAGRKLGLFPLIATLVVSQYGWINGVFELYLLDGPKAWFVLSLPYLIFNLIWVFLGKYLYQQKAYTTPGLFRLHYGKFTGGFAAILLTLIFLPIMYIHMGASVLNHSFGMSFEWATVLFIFLASLALITGGFKRIVYSDIFLFFLTYGGLFAVFIYLKMGHLNCIETIPTYRHVISETAASKYSYWGWWLLALIVFIDPSIHQRLWATKNENRVAKVMMSSIFFWLLFDVLIIGIISQKGHIAEFDTVYELAELLPTEIGLLFNFMLLAVILSTANTYFNISFNNIAFDLFRFKQKTNRIWLIAAAMFLITYLTTVYLYANSSVIDILFDLFPAAISGLFLPFISIFIPKIKLPNHFVIAQMFAATLTCLFFQINPYNMSNFATETPVAIGLLSSLILQIIFLITWPAENVTKN